MKNKILLGIVVILSFALLIVVKNKENEQPSLTNEKNIKIKDKENNIKDLNVEEYLIGVLAAEMPASFELEALKAQAVAARTFALYKIEHTKNQDYNVLTTVTDQSYITKEEMQEKWQTEYDKYFTKIKQAVEETKDEVMFYQGKIIESFYFAMSNGKTEDCATVFQEDLPYITTVESKWDNEQLKNFLVTTEFSKQEFCEKLSLNNCQEIKIGEIKKSETNRIISITVNNQVFLGTEFRRLLGLRSTDFEIKEDNGKMIITTKGYGHGVGMSQYGANGMAKEGSSYKDILNYYYKDITIKKMV